jgi:hypothetical protein
MDEETRAAFAAIHQESQASFDALRTLMNDQHERLINQLKNLSHDFQNTKGFLITMYAADWSAKRAVQ